MKNLRVALIAGVLSLIGCSSAPDSSRDESKAPNKDKAADQIVSAKTAYWEMYKSARGWATDIACLGLQSKSVPGIKNEEGKSVMWSATFGSPGKRNARIFFYSAVSRSPDVYKGVTARQPVRWSGPSSDVMPFSDFPVDSDGAYKAALSDAGAWVKKHPDKEVSISLGSTSRFAGPVWYVLWGNEKSGGYVVLVNATNGAIIKK